MIKLRTIEISNLLDLKKFVVEFKNIIGPKAYIYLEAPIGSGKTTFIVYFCEHFGLQMVQSPTYAIHHRYENSNVCIDHFDLYRLESDDQIEASGFNDLLAQKADYKLVEWAERLDLQAYTSFSPSYLLKIKRISDSEIRQFEIYQIS